MKIVVVGLFLLVCSGANAQDDSLAGSFLSGKLLTQATYFS